MPHGRPFPAYADLVEPLKKFWGLTSSEEDPDIQVVVDALKIGPPEMSFSFFSGQPSVAAEFARAGVGLVSGEFTQAFVEVSELKVLSSAGGCSLYMNDVFSGWTTATQLFLARGHEYGAVPGVYSAIDNRVAATITGEVKLMNGVILGSTTTWVDIPGTFVLAHPSMLYFRSSALNTNMNVMGKVRVITK